MQSWQRSKRLFIGGGAGAVVGGAVGVGMAVAVQALSFGLAVRSKSATAMSTFAFISSVHSCVDPRSCLYWCCSAGW